MNHKIQKHLKRQLNKHFSIKFYISLVFLMFMDSNSYQKAKERYKYLIKIEYNQLDEKTKKLLVTNKNNNNMDLTQYNNVYEVEKELCSTIISIPKKCVVKYLEKHIFEIAIDDYKDAYDQSKKHICGFVNKYNSTNGAVCFVKDISINYKHLSSQVAEVEYIIAVCSEIVKNN